MNKKVSLRNYRESDLKFLHELLSDELTKKYFPFMYTTCLEQSHLRLRTRLQDPEWGISNRFLVQDFWSKKPVGEISGRFDKKNKRKMEISVIIHPDSRGKGYAKASTLEFIKKMKKENPDLETFVMEIARSNESSKAVARKLEFRLNEDRDGESKNTQFWEKSKDEL